MSTDYRFAGRLTHPCSKEIQFGLFSAQDIVNLSELEVTHPLLYRKDDPLRHPELHGVLDNRLVCVLALQPLWER